MAKRKITNQSRDFKGVWIPAEYWLDPNLTMMEIMFITEIDSLDRGEGCFASNNHFADFFGVTPGRASQIVKSLKKKGYIEVTYERNGKQVVRRLIRVVRKLKGGIKYSKRGYLENAEGSNTVFSNTESNTEEGSKAGQSPAQTMAFSKRDQKNISVKDTGQAKSLPDEKIPYKKILDYLNQKTGKDYRNVPGNQDFIRARWDDGYRFDDFIKVIDNKVAEWKGTGVTFSDGTLAEKYLRPSTLFRKKKFDEYLNQTVDRTANNAPEEYQGLFDQQPEYNAETGELPF